MNRVYFDHNATTPLLPVAREAMAQAMGELGNASSAHREGRAAHQMLQMARGDLERILGAQRDSLIFTSGGTEAINLALRGAVEASFYDGTGGASGIRRMFIGATEHAAVNAAAAALMERSEVTIETLPVRASGQVDLDHFAARLQAYDRAREGKFLVALMLANNETGVIQDFARIAPLISQQGGYLFIDAVQAFGKLPVDFGALGADLMAISAHKIGGPAGIGALIVKPGVALDAINVGGGQEFRRRGGTENLIGIAGFAAAAAAIDFARMDQVSRLRDAIEDALQSFKIAGLKIWGADTGRLPNTLCFSAPGFKSQTQVMALDLAGYATSAGAACSSGKVALSPVLAAMGASPEEADSCLRVSLGQGNDRAATEGFVKAWYDAYKNAQAVKAA